MTNMRVVSEGVYESSDDQLDTDTASEFASFIDDMNSTENADAWVTVMRIPTDARGLPLPNSKHLGQLFNEPLGASSINDIIERIRRDFIRPGETSITVRIIGKQQGQRGIKFNRIYTIEKPSGPKTSEGGRESLGDIARMMMEMQRATDERFERLLTHRGPVVQSESVVDSLVKLAPILTPFITGLMGRPPVPLGNPAGDLLATLKAFKEARNLFDGNSGGGDESGDTMKTIRAVAEAVGPGLKFLAHREERMTAHQRMTAAALPAPATPAKAAPPPIRPKAVPPKAPVRPIPKKAATPPNNQSEVSEMELKELREKVETLAQLCDDGQDAAEVAKLVVDNVDDDQLEELYNQVEPENFVARIKLLHKAAVTGREEWFEKLRVAILAQYEADPDAADAGAPEVAAPAPVLDATNVNGAALDASPVDLDEIPDAGRTQ
jgi:hypothetical protein